MTEWIFTVSCDSSDADVYASVSTAAEYYSADLTVNCVGWGRLSPALRKEVIAHELSHALLSPLTPETPTRSDTILEERVCTILQRSLGLLLPDAPATVCTCQH